MCEHEKAPTASNKLNQLSVTQAYPVPLAQSPPNRGSQRPFKCGWEGPGLKHSSQNIANGCRSTKKGVPSQFRPPCMLSGTGMCHSTGSPRWWSSCLSQGRGFNPNRASDSGSSPVSPGYRESSPWGLRGGPLSSAGVLLLRSCATSRGVTEK